MRAFLALLVTVALAGPALAQDNHVQRYGEPDHEKTEAEKAADKAAARAYEKSLNVIPDAGGASDPWGGVRSTDAPKTTAAKPKKTKSSAEAK